MKKQILIIFFMVLVLVVLMILISTDFNKQRNEYITNTATPKLEATPTFSPIPTPTQTIVESTPTETDSHFVEYTSYTADELSLMGISLGMNISDVENILGEPINITEEYYIGISGYLLYYEYEFGGVEFYRATSENVEESYVNGVYVTVDGINPLWGVEVGDSAMEVFSKLGIPYAQIEQRYPRLSLNNENIGRILYQNLTSNEVEMIEVYFGNIENYNSLYITFKDGKVMVFGISGPHLS